MMKKAILTALTVTVIGTGAMTASQAFAQTDTSGEPMSSLAQKIAEKFGLNQADVQAVFDQERQERLAQRQAAFEANLDQLVSEGKITADQKQLILDKAAELRTKQTSFKPAFQNLTEEERKAARSQNRQELENWATQHGIDLQYLRLLGGHGFGFKGPGKAMPVSN